MRRQPDSRIAGGAKNASPSINHRQMGRHLNADSGGRGVCKKAGPSRDIGASTYSNLRISAASEYSRVRRQRNVGMHSAALPLPEISIFAISAFNAVATEARDFEFIICRKRFVEIGPAPWIDQTGSIFQVWPAPEI